MKEELGKIKGEVTEIVEEWQELTPSVIGCYFSIAGQTSHITLLPFTSLPVIHIFTCRL